MHVSEVSVNFESIDRCRCCGSDRLEEVLDLGGQPPANSLQLPDGPRRGAVPLLVVRCGSCATVQLSATVDPSELFSDYVWVTGTASATVAFSEVFCREVLSRWCASGEEPSGKPGLVVEVGSNDGTFLKNFKRQECQVVGVEPAQNIAKLAVSAGIPTRSEFFDVDTAASLYSEFGPADVVIARNVIPHVADIHTVLEGITRLLGRSGLVAIEFHYAGSILEGLQYDAIYHEHLFYFSLETLGAVCESHGLHAFDVFESPLSGGSLVLLLAPEKRTSSSQLQARLVDEAELSVNALGNWQAFGEAAKAHAGDLFRLVSDFAEQGPVVGYGASARSSTLLNAADISVEQVGAVIDRNALKYGRLTPGSHIPIVSYEDGRTLLRDASSLLLLAWNFESEIVADVRGEGFQGEILVPLPGGPRVVSDFAKQGPVVGQRESASSSTLVIEPTPLEGAFTVSLERREDERGFFARAFCREEFEAAGLEPAIVQANLSYNAVRGTLRGLHYQHPPYQETKLVRCVRGSVYDVIVDVRPGSLTYLQWYGIELSAENAVALFVPRGFAHGLITLEDDASVLYMVSESHAPGFEGGLRWDDPQVGIDWPITPTVISEKDSDWPDHRA